MVRKKTNTGPRNPQNPYFVPKKKTYYDYEHVKEALQKNMGMIYATAGALDISPSTMALYIKRWPRLKKYIRWGKVRQNDIAELKLWEMVVGETLDGVPLDIDWNTRLRAIQHWLKCKGNECWKPVKVIRDERTDASKQIPVPTALPLEERLKLLESVRQKQISITITEPVMDSVSLQGPQPILSTVPTGSVVLENTPLLENKKESKTQSQPTPANLQT